MSPGGQIFGLRADHLLPAFTLPFLERNFRIGRFRMGICHPIPQRNCGRFTRPSLDPPGKELTPIWTSKFPWSIEGFDDHEDEDEGEREIRTPGFSRNLNFRLKLKAKSGILP